ncbi:MAG: LPXTG cell wall anchor domain-containing protein [Oscillospiraceae bacterium]|nr:LPXTG cell wall anchor domain-containing protein [Oscillospiraceae bacterium]
MKHNKLLCLLLLTALLCLLLLPATAAETPDFTRTGSIRLTVRYEGREVGGGELTLYQVATLQDENGYRYVPVPGLEAIDFTFDKIESPDLPAEVLKQVKAAGLTGTAKRIGGDGVVFFGELTLGLYLVEQTENAPGFTSIQPFFVTIPMQENGELIYDVDASPKPLPPQPTEPTNPTEPTEPTATSKPPEPTEPFLPQTGQLNWPIPVLAILGAALLLAGLFVLLRGRKERG